MIEKASCIHIQACFDSDLEGSQQKKKSTSGATLLLWGVPLAASSRTQASQASSSAEAELYVMGMAVHDSLHLKSFLQEMQISQLAKPFELTVFTDSSSGEALASKLGLTRKSKHVQLRYLFRKDLLAIGQLQLRKIPAGKNPAAMLTKHLTASTLHKLFPKLGVRTRAVDSGALLSLLNLEMLGSPRKEQSSFFIGMMAKHPVTDQLVASRVATRPVPSNSFPQPSQAAVPNLQSSQRSFSLSSFGLYFFVVALLCANLVAKVSFVNFKICSLLLSGMRSLMQLCFDAVIVFKQWAFRTTFWTRALRTTSSSFALGSLLTTSLQRPMPSMKPRTPAQLSASSTATLPRTALCTHSWRTRFLTILLSTCLGWVASAYQGQSFTLKASFAQTSSFSSFTSILVSFHILEAKKMAYFTHDQLIPLLLANEVYLLPPALLQHVMEGMLFNDELEEVSDRLNSHWVSDHLPKLPRKDELQFWMVLARKQWKALSSQTSSSFRHRRSVDLPMPNLANWQA